MSDTPETDALGTFTVFDHAGQPYQSDLVPGDFARRLELERNALKKQLSEIEKYWVDAELARNELRSRLSDALVERDEYRRRWQDWERWAKQAVQYFRRVPLDTATVGMRNTLTHWMQDMKEAK
jgi:hypothetical protein